MDSLLEAIVLGFVQGATEFLPISSSGHLVIIEHWMELPVSEFLFFDILLHIATLIAVCLFFYRRITYLITNSIKWLSGNRDEQVKMEVMLIAAILLSTVITAFLGVTLKKSGTMLFMRDNAWAVGICFVITGGLLASTLIRNSRDNLIPGQWPVNIWVFAILLGLAQSFAILPGISRSGSTICAALLLGASKERAVEYSFLISIPAIIGAMLFEIGDATLNMPLSFALAGFVTSLFSGLLFLWILVWLVRVGKLHHFAIYVIPLGLWVIWSSV